MTGKIRPKAAGRGVVQFGPYSLISLIKYIEMKLFLKVLAVLCFVIFALVSGQRFTLLNTYRDTMPTKIDATSGKVVALNVHDTVVYITQSEADYLDSLREIQNFGFPILAFLVLWVYKPKWLNVR